MSCSAKIIGVVYAEPKNPLDPSCGCYNYGHYVNGKPCHHFSQCASCRLSTNLEKAMARDLEAL